MKMNKSDLPSDLPIDVVLRRLQTDDISQVIEIEREAFSPLWISTPFKRELNNRYTSYLVACWESGNGNWVGGLDAEGVPAPDNSPDKLSDESNSSNSGSSWRRMASKFQGLIGKRPDHETSGSFIAGYVSVWYQGEEAHITEIAVRENLRGRGYGELLLIGSLRAAVEYGSKVMTLEARVSNFIAQRLYEKYGFKTVGIRRAYYSDNREDAVIMTTSPINTGEYQQLFEDLQTTYRTRWGEIPMDL